MELKTKLATVHRTNPVDGKRSSEQEMRVVWPRVWIRKPSTLGEYPAPNLFLCEFEDSLWSSLVSLGFRQFYKRRRRC